MSKIKTIYKNKVTKFYYTFEKAFNEYQNDSFEIYNNVWLTIKEDIKKNIITINKKSKYKIKKTRFIKRINNKS